MHKRTTSLNVGASVQSLAAPIQCQKYRDHPPADIFIRATVEVVGTLGQGMDGLLRLCAQHIRAAGTGVGSSMSYAVMVSALRQKVSVTLQRAQALVIHHKSTKVHLRHLYKLALPSCLSLWQIYS